LCPKDKTVLVIWFGDLPLAPPVAGNSMESAWSFEQEGTIFAENNMPLFPYSFKMIYIHETDLQQ